MRRVRSAKSTARASEYMREKRSDPVFRAKQAEYDKNRKAANPEKFKEQRKAHYDTNWAWRLIKTASQSRKGGSDRRRTLASAVTITAEDLERIWETQGGLCYFTGVSMLKAARSLFSVSADRLDSSCGYVPGNVVLTCKAANLARSTASEAEFCDWLKAVTQHY